MKKAMQLCGGAVAAFGLTVGGAVAQEDTTQPQPNPPVQQPAENLQNADQARPGQPGEQAGQTAQNQQARMGRLHELDDLIGAKIRNPQNEDLGEIEEMVVDVNDGSIRYAVVSFGGFLDVGDELFAVPLKAMTLQKDDDGEPTFVVDIDKQRLENAQGFDKDNWPNFADASFAANVNKTFGIENEPQTSARPGALYKLSTFEGVNVRDQGNTELGEIEWILIDPQQAKVAFVAIDLEDEVEANDADDDAHVLIPMQALSLKTVDSDTFLQARAAMDKIKSAPTMTEAQLEDSKSHQQLRQKVESHFGTAGRQPANGLEQPAQPRSDLPQEQPQTEQPQSEQPQSDPAQEPAVDPAPGLDSPAVPN